MSDIEEKDTEEPGKDKGLSISEALDVAMETHGVADDDAIQVDSKPDFTGGEKPAGSTKPATTPSDDDSVEAQEPQAETAEVIGQPQWLTKEEKLHFAKAPPELKKVILANEQRAQEFVRRMQSETDRAANKYKELDEQFAPVRDRMYRQGISEGDAVRRFLTWQKNMEENPHETLREFIATFGLSPQDLVEQPQEQGNRDPRLDEVLRKQQELEAWKAQQEQAVTMQRNQAVMSDIARFKSETDANGNVLRPYVEFFEPQLAKVAEQLRQAYPAASNYEILDASYKYIMDQTNQHLIQPHVSRAQSEEVTSIKQKAERARRAAGSISSTPGNGASTYKPKGIREALDAAFEQHSR